MSHDPNRKLVEAYYLVQEAQRLTQRQLPTVAKVLEGQADVVGNYLDAVGAEGEEGLHEAYRPLRWGRHSRLYQLLGKTNFDEVTATLDVATAKIDSGYQE